MEHSDYDDKYEPVEPNYYDYKAVNNLDKNIDHLLSNNQILSIHILAFEVNNEAKNPFLKYFLHKNESTEVLDFLTLYFSEEFTNTNLIELHSKIYLYTFLNLTNFNNFLETINYKGCYIENNKLYIFYDLTNCKIQLNDIYKDSKIWVCLLDELVNENKVCDFNVSPSVADFFVNNFEFCFLYNKNNEMYNLPIAGYVAKEDRLLNFTYVFGVSKSNANEAFGSYYYFTNYDNVLNHLNLLRDREKEKLNKKVGIVRFALFLENANFIDNYPTGNDLETLNRQNTSNINNYDNLWENKYDSIFLGNIELNDGKILNDVPLIVLKNYEQQSPLSYHYINKSNKII
jgi:hypothetical protein